MKRLTALLIALALIAGMVGCPAEPGADPDPPVRYELTIASTEGGQVTTPGEGAATYEAGAVVEIIAEADAGYRFGSWTGDVDTIAGVDAASTTVRIEANYTITANFIAQYELIISSTEGGRVTTPGEGVFAYDAGTVVDLIGEADDGYQFVGWAGDIGAIADADAGSTTVTVTGNYAFAAGFAKEVRDWYALDAIRDNLSGGYLLMNDLDSTTDGYTELASSTANQGRGWEPIGTLAGRFSGAFDGQGHEIRGLVVSRPDEVGVGLFGVVHVGGVVRNLGLVNAAASGDLYVGGVVGANLGTLTNSYYIGDLTGDWRVGGLAGINLGTVSNCYAGGSVTGREHVGGLVGDNLRGTLSSSHYSGSVVGELRVGGLMGFNQWGMISNSHYDYDEVRINGENIITIGALFAEDFHEWLANDRFLDVNARLSQEDGYYLINDLEDFRQLLAFGQADSLKFRLKNDLDLRNAPDFYIPYLAGEFDGNNHRIQNLNFDLDFVCQAGLFGYLAPGGKAARVGVENADIAGKAFVGSLVGWNHGTVDNCYATGRVTASSHSGGLVGDNIGGAVSNSCFAAGSVTGEGEFGGLVAENHGATVCNSYYNYDEVRINGENIITIGALFTEDFHEWLANDRFLDVNARLSQEDGSYLINDLEDFRQLLAFGQADSLKFRLKNDLDLRNAPDFYIPYLAGEFDGDGHKISNLGINLDLISQVGLFGYLAAGGKVTQVGVEDARVMTRSWHAGALVGWNDGTVSNSYSIGEVISHGTPGGLVGRNDGTVSSSYSVGRVTGDLHVGGLVGGNHGGVVNCYSTGNVTGGERVGGLIGVNIGAVTNSYSACNVVGDDSVGGLVGLHWGSISSSFWDVQASGIEGSAGATGKTTVEMRTLATFADPNTPGLDEPWNIVAVASTGDHNTSYIWNIVDGQTYPFLSWQSVS